MYEEPPYKVVDNFLPLLYHKQLQSVLCGPEHPWYFQSNITSEQEGVIGGFGLNAWVIRYDYPNEIAKGHGASSISEMIMPLCLTIQEFIGAKSIAKVRCDMTLYNPNVHKHQPHIDIGNTPHIAAVYYVNDSDGNTVLYKQRSEVDDPSTFPKQLDVLTEVEPKANRLLVFEGSLIHTGHSPSKNNNRVIINSDYYI